MMSPLTVREVLKSATVQLQAADIDSASLDAELLLAHVLGSDRTWLYSHSEDYMVAGDLDTFTSFLSRRADHEPLAYLIGLRWFFGLEFEVTPAVLIPRPETELLVELALHWVAANPGTNRRIVDVGTGSGAIAIAIASETASEVSLVAIDQSEAALTIARKNAERLHVADRIHFLQGDLLSPLTESVDLIVANLPYIPSADIACLMPEVRDHEPLTALDGGATGLKFIQRLLAEAKHYLQPEGALLLEIAFDQGAEAMKLAQEFFPDARVSIIQDLAGHDRILSIQTN